MGKTCLRAVIDHPDLELAGVYVYGEKKEGRDAGEIARRAPTGIIATRSIEEILEISMQTWSSMHHVYKFHTRLTRVISAVCSNLVKT